MGPNRAATLAASLEQDTENIIEPALGIIYVLATLLFICKAGGGDEEVALKMVIIQRRIL